MNQSQEGREYIPGGRTNHRREEGIYLEGEPITAGKRVYTWSGIQSHEGGEGIPPESHEGGECIPGVGLNYTREESIYLEWEPIT